MLICPIIRGFMRFCFHAIHGNTMLSTNNTFYSNLKYTTKTKLSINEWCGSINLQLRLFFEIVNE